MSGTPVSHHLMVVSWFTVLGLTLAPACVSWAEEPKPGSELPIDRGLMQRLSNFTLKDVTSGRSTPCTATRAERRSCSCSWETTAPWATSTFPGWSSSIASSARRASCSWASTPTLTRPRRTSPRTSPSAGIEFPVLKDPANLVADSALVERTCEVVVLDGFARIRYRGAIDDQYQQGKGKDAPDHNYLRDALTAMVADQPIKVPATKVAGCLIDRVAVKPVEQAKAPRIRPAAPEVASVLEAREKEHPIEVGKVSYAADVAAIIQNKCQTCHRPGQVGPFSLLTYDDARKHSAMIREVVDERRMPPWHADPRYGHFVNDRSLSAEGARDVAGLGRSGDARWVTPRTRRRPARFPRGGRSASPTSFSSCPRPTTCRLRGWSRTFTSGCRPTSRKTCGSRRPRPCPATVRSSITSSFT